MTHTEGDWEQADEAVRAIGTNALPYLVRELGAKYSPTKWRVFQLAWKQAVIPVRYIHSDERRSRVVAAFQALGRMATSAVPNIEKYLSDPELRHDAITALKAVLEDAERQRDDETNNDAP